MLQLIPCEKYVFMTGNDEGKNMNKKKEKTATEIAAKQLVKQKKAKRMPK